MPIRNGFPPSTGQLAKIGAPEHLVSTPASLGFDGVGDAQTSFRAVVFDREVNVARRHRRQRRSSGP